MKKARRQYQSASGLRLEYRFSIALKIRVLSWMQATGVCTSHQIASALKLNVNDVNRLLRELEYRGSVTRDIHTGKNYATNYHVTPSGILWLEQLTYDSNKIQR